jgi:hypothetical protein
MSRLSPETRARLDALLRPAEDQSEKSDADPSAQPAPALLLRLRADPGRPGLVGVQDALARLELVREIGLPPGLFDGVLPHELERYRRRVSTEAPYELRRHPEAARIAGLAAFAHLRGRTLTDDLLDLLIETIHHIGARAEHRVVANCSRIYGASRASKICCSRSPVPLWTNRMALCEMCRRTNSARSGPRGEGHGSNLPDHAAHRDPEFLQGPLPPYGAADSAKARIPF